MFYAPFWILIGIFVLTALLVIARRGFTFVDFQAYVMMAAISLLLDMVFCKWLGYYHYVVQSPLKAFYSLFFCVIGYPAIGLIFIKYIPSSWWKIALYIGAWSAAITIVEILVMPLGIVKYSKWVILPDSPIIYTLCFSGAFGYYRLLQKRMRYYRQEGFFRHR